MPDATPSEPRFFRWDVNPGPLALLDRALAALKDPDGRADRTRQIGTARGILAHLKTWLVAIKAEDLPSPPHPEASCPTSGCVHAREVVRLKLALGQARLAAELIVDGTGKLLGEREGS